MARIPEKPQRREPAARGRVLPAETHTRKVKCHCERVFHNVAGTADYIGFIIRADDGKSRDC